MKFKKLRIFFKNFAAGRKALFAKIGVSIGTALVFKQLILWIADSKSLCDVLKNTQWGWINLYELLTQPWLYLAIALLSALLSQSSFSHFSKKIRNTDCWIDISMADIFENKGQILIPCNNIFFERLPYVGKNSIQAQLIKRMSKRKRKETTQDQLGEMISKELSKPDYKECEIEGKKQELGGEQYQVYEYGTIVPLSVKVDKKDRDILLSAMSEITEQGVSTIDSETLLQNIDKMWDYIAAHHTGDDTLVVPIMGTGSTRVPMPKQVVARYILYTFAERSAELGIRKLILSVYPNDYLSDNINLEELRTYANFLCKFPNRDFSI
ncbi:MAG: hypothetical protein IJL87_05935 [Clostridia bacterium]|nr:hypothetical protein [Clostridia bacterium]